jgi:oligopeptide transport system ATP-binding protein
MYLGLIVELADRDDLSASGTPVHPTPGCRPSRSPTLGGSGRQRIVLEGDVPSPAQPPSGCHLHTRCPLAERRCVVEPELREIRSGRYACCHFPLAPRETLFERVRLPAGRPAAAV